MIKPAIVDLIFGIVFDMGIRPEGRDEPIKTGAGSFRIESSSTIGPVL
jgi:hypothetical protein